MGLPAPPHSFESAARSEVQEEGIIQPSIRCDAGDKYRRVRVSKLTEESQASEAVIEVLTALKITVSRVRSWY